MHALKYNPDNLEFLASQLSPHLHLVNAACKFYIPIAKIFLNKLINAISKIIEL